MRIDQETLCVCGHYVLSHTCGLLQFGGKAKFTLEDIKEAKWSRGCSQCRPFNNCKEFRLENLKYLEYKLEEKENGHC